ncbi:MAG: PfkB domain protein [Firmicutes bacterium]|nr:PfkB domain protein [Bacillota bacterium]
MAANALGLPVVILSTIGQDLYGRYLLSELERHGLPTAGVTALDGESTPLTVVTVGEGGPRAMVTVQGAHKELDLAYYQGHSHLLDDCLEVFICGSYLLPKLDCRAAQAIALDARRKRKLVCFDPSWDPTNWSQPVREATLLLLPAVDVFLPNMGELCGLMGMADWRQAAEAAARLGPELVIKRGAAGSAALIDGHWFEADALPVDCRDTTGAGDVFDAAYLWARRQGWPPAERLQFANAVAGLVVQQEPRTDYPSLDEALRYCRSTNRD